MKRTFITFCVLLAAIASVGQTKRIGDYIESMSYNNGKAGAQRTRQYRPEGQAFVCENGVNRFTRALYGGWSDYRIETSDRPVFAIVKKNHHRHLRFLVNGVPLDSTDYCKAYYLNGMRRYFLSDKRWGDKPMLELKVVCSNDREGAVWWFTTKGFPQTVRFEARMCLTAQPKLQRNGDIGADKPGVFEAAPGEPGLQRSEWTADGDQSDSYFTLDSIRQIVRLTDEEARRRFATAYGYCNQIGSQIYFSTPDPFVNPLASALAFAADGDWDGQTWLHGCVGWRMPLAGWRAAYVGDVLGWNDRQVSHFDAYANSQVKNVSATLPHPTQDPAQQMARAEKRWGTQMYSNGYICRNPNRNDQMHHYDMNLNYVDELLWHFQYDADTAYMRKMWPLIKSHLAWEKRNYDPDGDHLYDAYCCIWASDALYYSGGAVTHSSAYNYRGNLLAARIAEILGENAEPYRREADAILTAMNQRLWLPEKGHWAEYQDLMGLRRTHRNAAVWSIYTPIDCGACSPEQAYRATRYIDAQIPHISVEDTGLQTITTSNWMPYSWSINNVAAAEVMHTALAYFEAGRAEDGFRLMKANIMDQMYYGQSPANFGQISHYDAARGECYRDFGDCIGISSRTLMQGLFGIIPQALYGQCVLRPGFPREWDSVHVRTPYLEYQFTRKNGVDRYVITQHFRQPLRIVLRQNTGLGRFKDTMGNSDRRQVIEVPTAAYNDEPAAPAVRRTAAVPDHVEPSADARYIPVRMDRYLNASVTDIFRQEYLSPRPPYTTLRIPLQGIGEWCHPHYCPDINDSVFRSRIQHGEIRVAGVPFRTPARGRNIVYTSLWDNYPDSVSIPLKGSAARVWLLMAGSTNHMQCDIDNALVTVSYQDGTADTLRLIPPYNWCPIEQDYYVDGQAFRTLEPCPYRVALGTATVSRQLGQDLRIEGVYGREIPGGAATMLSLPLDSRKRLRSLTLRTLSNDVVVGLMGATLQP